MIGLDNIKLGWYKFKVAVGLGDSSENQAAIAKIDQGIESRKKAIAETEPINYSRICWRQRTAWAV